MQDTYQQIALLARVHPAWSLTEIKTLSARERTYWLALARYEAERRQSAV